MDGSAASESVQIMSILSQQGGDVGAVLGSAGAAEAIVRASLVNEDVGHFKSHKYGISDTITTSWAALTAVLHDAYFPRRALYGICAFYV